MGRFDMPGFRPPGPYVREMRRFGIVPAAPGPADAIDPYAADRAYWDSFAWRPDAAGEAPRKPAPDSR